MSKELVYKWLNKNSTYHLCIYSDGTYQFKGYGEDQYSYWKIEDEVLCLKHSVDFDTWRPWNDNEAAGLNARMLIEKIKDYYVEKELLGL